MRNSRWRVALNHSPPYEIGDGEKHFEQYKVWSVIRKYQADKQSPPREMSDGETHSWATWHRSSSLGKVMTGSKSSCRSMVRCWVGARACESAMLLSCNSSHFNVRTILQLFQPKPKSTRVSRRVSDEVFHDNDSQKFSYSFDYVPVFSKKTGHKPFHYTDTHI